MERSQKGTVNLTHSSKTSFTNPTGDAHPTGISHVLSITHLRKRIYGNALAILIAFVLELYIKKINESKHNSEVYISLRSANNEKPL